MVGYSRKVDLDFESAVSKVKEKLFEEGFGILCEIDVKKTIKEKIGKDFDDYIILGACNPEYAFGVLTENKEFGLLMPCNVNVYVENGEVYVSAIAPMLLAEQFGSEKIKEIAKEVEEKLKKVVDSI